MSAPIGEAEAQPSTTRSSRTRACVGNPPRQTEDPQSPPCIGTIFDGDNGGPTARGVTGTEIAVAVPLRSASPARTAMIEALFEHFNLRYEFYGRRLKMVPVISNPNDAVQARQAAADVGALGVFASLTFDYEFFTSWSSAYFQETARQGVVTVALDTSRMLTDAVIYDSLDPFVWSVYPSVEQRYRNASDLVCTALANRPAAHAGTGVAGKPRRFGIIAAADISVPSTSALEAGLADCGVLATTVKLTAGAAVRTAHEALKRDGITTVLCVCGGNWFPSNLLGEAVAAAYFPEWIPIYHYVADEYFGNFIRAGATYDQLQNVLMMSTLSKTAPTQARASFNAIMSIRPDVLQMSGGINELTAYGDFLYKQMMVLTAGIQGAGPGLSPQSFGAALMAMQFPNPNAGAAPAWQQSVGFGPGDHSFYDDYALAWWSRRAEVLNPGAPAGAGAWCYVNQGARYRVGTFPVNADDLYFDHTKPCR